MDNLEAAKMLVVAWYKGWHLRNYARHITGNMNFEMCNAEELSKNFKFMSDIGHLYIARGKGIEVRRYIADYLPTVNNKLWDAGGDVKRLMKVANEIVKTKAVRGNVHSKEAEETRKLARKAKANNLSTAMYLEHRERCNAKGWNIVK